MFADCLTKQTLENVATLSHIPFVKKYYLAGGTAVALNLGHRLSVDLDFFSPTPEKPTLIASALANAGNLDIFQNDEGTFNGSLNGVKLSFFLYPYRLLQDTDRFEGLSVAAFPDLVCMKLDAIASRGTKRDFVDLYFLLQKSNIDDALELFMKKFTTQNVPITHILKSLIYFGDAEAEGELQMKIDIDWETIKAYFQEIVSTYSKKTLA